MGVAGVVGWGVCVKAQGLGLSSGLRSHPSPPSPSQRPSLTGITHWPGPPDGAQVHPQGLLPAQDAALCWDHAHGPDTPREKKPAFCLAPSGAVTIRTSDKTSVGEDRDPQALLGDLEWHQHHGK